MKSHCVFWILGLGIIGSAGCELLGSSAHTLGYEVHTCLQEYAEQRRNNQWASEAWAATRQANPGLPGSRDYAAGFHDGFTDYLWHGGNGEPPPLPPLRYRALSYQTPEGYRAIEEWFAGYRHGALVARQKGLRDLVTGPSSLRSLPHNPAPSVHVPGEVVHELPLPASPAQPVKRPDDAVAPVLPPPARLETTPRSDTGSTRPAPTPAPTFDRLFVDTPSTEVSPGPAREVAPVLPPPARLDTAPRLDPGSSKPAMAPAPRFDRLFVSTPSTEASTQPVKLPDGLVAPVLPPPARLETAPRSDTSSTRPAMTPPPKIDPFFVSSPSMEASPQPTREAVPMLQPASPSRGGSGVHLMDALPQARGAVPEGPVTPILRIKPDRDQ